MKRAIGLILLFATTLIAHGQARAVRWYERGLAFKESHDYASALNAFKKAASIRKHYSEALLQIGWCYIEVQQYDRAVEILRQDVSNAPTNPSGAHYELAHAFTGLRDYDSAIYHYSQAITGGLVAAYKERAFVFQQIGDCEHALADFRRHEELGDQANSPNATYFFRKGWCENETGDHVAAVVSLNQCIAIDRGYAQCYMELGYGYYKINRNKEAVGSYHSAFRLQDSLAADALFGIANVFFDNLSDLDSAAIYFIRGLAREPGNRQANYRLGWCYNEQGHYADALGPLKAAVALNTADMDAHTELGYTLYRLKSYDEALVQLMHVVKSDSTDELSRYYAGLCYAATGDEAGLAMIRAELGVLESDYVFELDRVSP